LLTRGEKCPTSPLLLEKSMKILSSFDFGRSRNSRDWNLFLDGQIREFETADLSGLRPETFAMEIRAKGKAKGLRVRALINKETGSVTVQAFKPGVDLLELKTPLTASPVPYSVADRILQLLAEGPMKKSQFTDHINRPVHEIDNELEGLQAQGKIRKGTRLAKGKRGGGRPAEVWELMPELRNGKSSADALFVASISVDEDGEFSVLLMDGEGGIRPTVKILELVRDQINRHLEHCCNG
jgi:hypothetical protein